MKDEGPRATAEHVPSSPVVPGLSKARSTLGDVYNRPK